MSRSQAGGRASSEWSQLNVKFQLELLPRRWMTDRFFAVVAHAADLRSSMLWSSLPTTWTGKLDDLSWRFTICERVDGLSRPILRWTRGTTSRAAAMRGARKKLAEFVARYGEGSR